MSTTTRRMTAEELLLMPDDNLRHELVEGELRTMSPANNEHGGVAANLCIHLGSFVLSRQLGRLFAAETGFIIARGPDTVLAPDVSFIRRDRIPASGLLKAFWPGAPDLAAEVVSPGDTRREVAEKTARWLKAGVRLLWVVYPERRTVEVHRAGVEVIVLGEDDTLDGQDVVPGFRCRVGEIFGEGESLTQE